MRTPKEIVDSYLKATPEEREKYSQRKGFIETIDDKILQILIKNVEENKR